MLCRYNSMQSILGGAVMSLFLIALYAPWFSNGSMLVAIAVSVAVNIFLMAGCMELLPPHGVNISHLQTVSMCCLCCVTTGCKPCMKIAHTCCCFCLPPIGSSSDVARSLQMLNCLQRSSVVCITVMCCCISSSQLSSSLIGHQEQASFVF